MQVDDDMTNSIFKRREWRYAIAFGAILLTLCAAFAGMWISADRTYAFVETSMDETNTVTFGELLLGNYDVDKSDGKVFDGVRFWEFVDALRGDGEAKTAVADLSDKDAQAIRDINDGKDIVVEIDDKLWTVTDLRKLDDGRVIATMWLATSSEKSQWNTWCAHTPTSAYPSNMYSTSYIRAQALNSGGCGYVAKNGATNLSKIQQNAEHAYAKFTMPEVKTDTARPSRNLSLINYIVQPVDVAYQETETIRTFVDAWRTVPNEAWGTPALENYYDGNMNYISKSFYAEWASDYLWLPKIGRAHV